MEKILENSNIFKNTYELMLRQDLESIKEHIEQDYIQKSNENIDSIKKDTKSNTEILFMLIQKNKTLNWPAKIKIMTCIHRMLIDVGENFSEDFQQSRLIQLQVVNKENYKKTFKFQNQLFVDWVQNNIINIYYNYLQQIGWNFQIYKICVDDGFLPEADDFKLNYKMKFMWMFKIINIFNFIGKIQDNLKIAILNLDDNQTWLFKDLGLLIMHDLVSYYNVLSNETEQMVKRYIQLATCDAVQLFELIQMLENCTLTIKDFLELKQYVDPQNVIVEPTWFNLDDEQIDEFQNYYKKIQVLQYNSNQMKKDLQNLLQRQDLSAQPVHQVLNRSKSPHVEPNNLVLKTQQGKSSSFISEKKGNQYITEPDINAMQLKAIQGNNNKKNPKNQQNQSNQAEQSQKQPFKILSKATILKNEELEKKRKQEQLQKQFDNNNNQQDFSFDNQQEEQDEEEEERKQNRQNKDNDNNLQDKQEDINNKSLQNDQMNDKQEQEQQEDFGGDDDYLETDKDDQIFKQNLDEQENEMKDKNQYNFNQSRKMQNGDQIDGEFEFQEGSSVDEDEIIKLPDENGEKESNKLSKEERIKRKQQKMFKKRGNGSKNQKNSNKEDTNLQEELSLGDKTYQNQEEIQQHQINDDSDIQSGNRVELKNQNQPQHEVDNIHKETKIDQEEYEISNDKNNDIQVEQQVQDSHKQAQFKQFNQNQEELDDSDANKQNQSQNGSQNNNNSISNKSQYLKQDLNENAKDQNEQHTDMNLQKQDQSSKQNSFSENQIGQQENEQNEQENEEINDSKIQNIDDNKKDTWEQQNGIKTQQFEHEQQSQENSYEKEDQSSQMNKQQEDIEIKQQEKDEQEDISSIENKETIQQDNDLQKDDSDQKNEQNQIKSSDFQENQNENKSQDNDSKDQKVLQEMPCNQDNSLNQYNNE